MVRPSSPVLILILLLAAALSPAGARAQAPARDLPVTTRGFDFDRTRTGPSTPEMWIPFHLERQLFEGRDSVLVSLRIFNPLKQVVAIPVLRDPTAGGAPRLLNLAFRQPGRLTAFWDGRNLAGATVGTGIYYAELTAGEQKTTLKLVVVAPRRRSVLPWQ